MAPGSAFVYRFTPGGGWVWVEVTMRQLGAGKSGWNQHGHLFKEARFRARQSEDNRLGEGILKSYPKQSLHLRNPTEVLGPIQSLKNCILSQSQVIWRLDLSPVSHGTQSPVGGKEDRHTGISQEEQLHDKRRHLGLWEPLTETGGLWEGFPEEVRLSLILRGG